MNLPESHRFNKQDQKGYEHLGHIYGDVGSPNTCSRDV